MVTHHSERMIYALDRSHPEDAEFVYLTDREFFRGEESELSEGYERCRARALRVHPLDRSEYGAWWSLGLPPLLDPRFRPRA